MATQIQFTITSDAYYSPEELEGLKSDLISAAFEVDDEMLKESASIEIIEESTDKEKAQIRAAAIELISKGTLTVNVKVEDEDENEIIDSGDVSIAL